MAVHAPAKFVGLGGMDPSAPAGRDILREGQTSSVARPVIAMKGGKSRRSRRVRRVKRKQTRRQCRQRGGFLPSIGEGFAAAAAQYVLPVLHVPRRSGSCAPRAG